MKLERVQDGKWDYKLTDIFEQVWLIRATNRGAMYPAWVAVCGDEWIKSNVLHALLRQLQFRKCVLTHRCIREATGTVPGPKHPIPSCHVCAWTRRGIDLPVVE